MLETAACWTVGVPLGWVTLKHAVSAVPVPTSQTEVRASQRVCLFCDGSLFQVHSHLRENPAGRLSLQRTGTSPPEQTALVGDPGKTPPSL